MNDVLCIDLGASYTKVAFLRHPRPQDPPVARGGFFGDTWSEQGRCLNFDRDDADGFCLPSWAQERPGSPGVWIFANDGEAGAFKAAPYERQWKTSLFNNPSDARLRGLCARFLAYLLKASVAKFKRLGCLDGTNPCDLVITVPSMSGDEAYCQALRAAAEQACAQLPAEVARPARTRFRYEPLCNVLGLFSRGDNVWNGRQGLPREDRNVSLRGTFEASPIASAVQRYMHQRNMFGGGALQPAANHRLKVYVLDLGSFTADMACVSINVGPGVEVPELDVHATTHQSVPIGLSEAVDRHTHELVCSLPGIGPAARAAFANPEEFEAFKKQAYSGKPYYVGGSRPLPAHVDAEVHRLIRHYAKTVMDAFGEFQRRHGLDAVAVHATGGPLSAAYIQDEFIRLAAQVRMPLQLASAGEPWGLPVDLDGNARAQAVLSKAQKGQVSTPEQLSRVATALGGISCAWAHEDMSEQLDVVKASPAAPAAQQATGDLVEMALEMAMSAHHGRVDRAGKPCILHPLRVMHAVEGDEARAVALLHGVLDDTGITVDDLRREGFPAGVIAAVEALTPLDGEDDAAFLDRVRLVPLARQVKLADLEDKLDIRRLSDFAAQDAELIANYVRAWQRLRQA